MHIERLSCHGLRNLKNIDIVPEAPTVVLIGHNGQGKTNLLEALYLCATGRSFRFAQAKELVVHGGVHARAHAWLNRNDVRHEVQVELQLSGPSLRGRQKLSVDGRTWQRTARLLGLINVVAFFPDDLRVIKGAPEERRRFFDRATAGAEPQFVDAALAYHQALKARNALLRSEHAPTPPLIEAFDQQLVTYGSRMAALRAQALASLWPLAQRHLAALLPGFETAIALSSGLRVQPEPDNYAQAFAQELRQQLPRDRARGMTLCGPHRSDITTWLNGQDTRLYASQGQQRAVILALKLAELEHIAARLDSSPILLLDDVSSELDVERQERLFAQVATLGCQAWVSTTGSVTLPIKTAQQRLCVASGAVFPEGAKGPETL